MPEQVNQDPRKKISTGKKVLFSMIFGLLIILLIVLVEIGLRIAGFGYDTRAFITPRHVNDTYITNTNFFKKYYPGRVLAKPDTLRTMMVANKFSTDKMPNTLRGFVVGGSTAQGFPYQSNQSFSKITELALATSGKYEKVEVLNLGLSAITSYCVRDIASKLLPYEPDFLVIYAGHNEYYGTISTTTGGGFLTKNFYLALQEYRLFQLLFNIQNILNPPAEYPTLMEEQFSKQRLPLKPEMDQEVAVNFVKNIDAIVKTYQRLNIPVIIIGPVSNLYDMPPFSGEKDDDFKELIQRYAAAIEQDKVQELNRFYQARPQQKQYDRNANVRYLDAVARKKLTGKIDLDGFKSAKELDTLPFRAKEVLFKKLQEYCHNHAADNPNLFFIPLEQIMAQMNGTTAFGNKFFVDHLHFSQKGQQFVSRILAEQIAGIFHFDEKEKGRIARFYQDGSLIEKAIHYLPASRTEVYRKLRNLRENSPYNKMLVPYQRNDVDGLTEADVDQRLIDLILKAQSEKMDPSVIIAANYINQGRIKKGKKYLDLYLWTYPGCYRPYLIQARFKRALSRNISETLSTYKTAYLFSDKLKSIYDEIAVFLKENDRQDLFAEIEKFGEPIE